MPDGTVCDSTLSSDYTELSFTSCEGEDICDDFFEAGTLMSYNPTSVQSTTPGEYDIDLRVSMTEYNYVYWTIPVKIIVFCNFVDDMACSHTYLPELDPDFSRVELCYEDDPNFSLNFAVPA